MATIPAEIRIRQEFGEKPSKVIRDFAAMRFSKRLTAGAIGITTQTLRRMCRQYGINFVSQGEMVSQCKGRGKGWPKGRTRPWAPKPWKRQAAGEVGL